MGGNVNVNKRWAVRTVKCHSNFSFFKQIKK